MIALTIRQLPPALAKRIRDLAKKNSQSMNKTIIGLLGKSLGFKENQLKKRNLTELAGTWTEKEELEFKKTTDYFGKIDSDLWKL